MRIPARKGILKRYLPEKVANIQKKTFKLFLTQIIPIVNPFVRELPIMSPFCFHRYFFTFNEMQTLNSLDH